jgi:hypothetical protein
VIILDDARKRLAEMEKQSRRMKSLSAHSRENRATSEALEQFLQEAATSQRHRSGCTAICWSWPETGKTSVN